MPNQSPGAVEALTNECKMRADAYMAASSFRGADKLCAMEREKLHVALDKLSALAALHPQPAPAGCKEQCWACAESGIGCNLLNDGQPAPAVAVEALPDFDDSRVQTTYEVLCSSDEPPTGEHWEGFAARRIVAALAARSASAVAESQWRTMESAPKDGTHILAMLPDSETCHIICWVYASKGIRVGCGVYGWHVAWDGYPCAGYSAPTHWMPLPTLPTVGSGSAQEGQAE